MLGGAVGKKAVVAADRLVGVVGAEDADLTIDHFGARLTAPRVGALVAVRDGAAAGGIGNLRIHPPALTAGRQMAGEPRGAGVARVAQAVRAILCLPGLEAGLAVRIPFLLRLALRVAGHVLETRYVEPETAVVDRGRMGDAVVAAQCPRR